MMKASLVAMVTLFVALVLPFSSATAGEAVRVEVKNEQGGEVRPDLDTAQVELSFSEIQSGTARVFLSSPEPEFFSPTDFPIVEGTDLIDATLPVVNGKASFQYMFPIRGDYRLKVEVMDEKGNALGTHDLVISISENPEEVKNAVLFIALLAVFGFAVGYLLSRRRKHVHAV